MTEEQPPIYLDHNASTPVLPEVVDAMLPYLREHFGNPSATHSYGRSAREGVEQARGLVAALMGAELDEVLFTSGGTEANNLAIRGSIAALSGKTHVITSRIEHPATAVVCQHLEKRDWPVTWLGVDETGRIRPGEAVDAMHGETALVTLAQANSETGSLQPIAQVARAARERGLLVHTDAAQTTGKIPIDVEQLGIDLLSIAGHKLYAPKGVGALYVRRGTSLEPLVLGANHERGLRPGTENVASIVGLGAACQIASVTLSEELRRVRGLRDRLWDLLRAAVPGIALNGHPEDRLPNTLNVRFPGVSGNALLAAAPEIAASTGSACHAGSEAPSAVLLAMGLAPEVALESVRLSLGRSTTEEQVARAAAVLSAAWRSLSR